jgi:hypothetical protein
MRDIKGTITKLVKKYKTNDPFKIAVKSNICLSYEELGKTLGYYSSHKRFKFIHLNNSTFAPLKHTKSLDMLVFIPFSLCDFGVSNT